MQQNVGVVGLLQASAALYVALYMRLTTAKLHTVSSHFSIMISDNTAILKHSCRTYNNNSDKRSNSVPLIAENPRISGHYCETRLN